MCRLILNPELMDAAHLYVAMTRGARRLVVFSDRGNGAFSPRLP
jgi:hypothetical protein